LSDERFAYYVAQDAHYLREYARALAAVDVKARTHAETALFAEHAGATARVEIALHESLLPQLGLDGRQLASGSAPLTRLIRGCDGGRLTTSTR